MSNSMAEKEAKELVTDVRASLEKLRKGIVADKDVSFIGLFRFESEDGIEMHNFGEGDSLLLMALSEIEGLAVNFADDNVGRAAVVDIALQYLKDLKRSFLDGSFDSRSVVCFDDVGSSNLFGGQTMIDGGEQ